MTPEMTYPTNIKLANFMIHFLNICCIQLSSTVKTPRGGLTVKVTGSEAGLNINVTYLFYRAFWMEKFYIVVIYTFVRLLVVSKTIAEIVMDNIKLIIFQNRFLLYTKSGDILQTSGSLFISLIIYGCLYDILALLDLTTYIKNFRYVIANITENMLVLMTVIKISVLRIKCTVVPNILRVMINSTSEYKLPYKIKPLVKPYNVKSYAFGCIHEFLRIIMIISGYLGTDSFFASIGFHFTSRFAILKCEVENVLNNTDDPRQGIRKIILGHHRLISLLIEIFFFNFERYKCVERYEILADLFENSFNIVIGQYLFGTTILKKICSYKGMSLIPKFRKI
ncbi:odorant receptor 13a-like [Vespula squamosa]|uniref:Odorant receptor 13a-like n=1 Tax=Vespula squamosa TaxID=30214 RepID=A0ABD2BS76_VESSQ